MIDDPLNGGSDAGAWADAIPHLQGRPLAIDLFCGLGGWTDGLLALGYRVIGYDIEEHVYGDERYQGELVVQDVLTLHGSQFKDAALIVASPPCQEYSYMAMPWSLAKAKAARIRADETGAELERLNALFNACFRIQREASEAAGRHIPMVVENVRGAQPWVGKARHNFGSFYLWGDVPALMPAPVNAVKVPSFRFDGSGKSFQSASVRRTDVGKGARFTSRDCGTERRDAEGKKLGGDWFGSYAPGVQGPRNHGSGSKARKRASALIAKIPEPLSRHIGLTYWPAHLQGKVSNHPSRHLSNGNGAAEARCGGGFEHADATSNQNGRNHG